MPNERFKALSDDEMNADQQRVAKILREGPRKGLPGPFHALLRSPDLADRIRQVGDYIRYGNSLSDALRELVILMAARYWSAQYEWQAHRRISQAAGLDPAIPDAIAAGKRPAKMAADEALIYDFCRELLYDKDVSDAVYEAALTRFGERTVLDIVCTAGYFSFVSLILNTKRYPIPPEATPLAPLSGPPEA
ncbi:MAG: carboxymuconolactone decarboxylase family protein [Variibacter sp.]|nr:carboxymuconolactone decarboxylase family protein [Variibacter sp.]